MFDGIGDLISNLVGLGVLTIGLVSFGYALYGTSVANFDKQVRNFFLIFGTLLISIVVALYVF